MTTCSSTQLDISRSEALYARSVKSNATRFPVIDAFKAIASQLIVLHHLAAYGPLSDAVQQAAPGLISWLYDYARMAVQVFFVIGGYLAARAIFSSGRNSGSLATALFNRYLRIVVPFLAALIFSIVCAMAARHWMADDFIPDAPTWSQLFAHVLLLQGVLDFDALLAGAWFIAIDFQLFMLMVVIVWLSGKAAYSRNLISALITLMVAASLLWFNRDPGLDDWALYFFGAYGMGVVAYMAGMREKSGKFWFWLIVSLAVVALIIDFRARIMIALAVTITLFLTIDLKRSAQSGLSLLRYLGRISYALFLVHFSILLLVNAAFAGLGFSSPLAGGIGMLATWAVSLVVADLFYRRIEKPAAAIFRTAS